MFPHPNFIEYFYDDSEGERKQTILNLKKQQQPVMPQVLLT